MAQLRGDVVGQSRRIAVCRAVPGQLFQALLRVKAVFDQLGRIGVGQLVERKSATLGNLPGPAQGMLRMLGKSRSISSGVFRKRSAWRSF